MVHNVRQSRAREQHCTCPIGLDFKGSLVIHCSGNAEKCANRANLTLYEECITFAIMTAALISSSFAVNTFNHTLVAVGAGSPFPCPISTCATPPSSTPASIIFSTNIRPSHAVSSYLNTLFTQVIVLTVRASAQVVGILQPSPQAIALGIVKTNTINTTPTTRLGTPQTHAMLLQQPPELWRGIIPRQNSSSKFLSRPSTVTAFSMIEYIIRGVTEPLNYVGR